MCCINEILKYIVPISGQRIWGLVCCFLFSIVQIQSTSYEQNQFAVIKLINDKFVISSEHSQPEWVLQWEPHPLVDRHLESLEVQLQGQHLQPEIPRKTMMNLSNYK